MGNFFLQFVTLVNAMGASLTIALSRACVPWSPGCYRPKAEGTLLGAGSLQNYYDTTDGIDCAIGEYCEIPRRSGIRYEELARTRFPRRARKHRFYKRVFKFLYLKTFCHSEWKLAKKKRREYRLLSSVRGNFRPRAVVALGQIDPASLASSSRIATESGFVEPALDAAKRILSSTKDNLMTSTFASVIVGVYQLCRSRNNVDRIAALFQMISAIGLGDVIDTSHRISKEIREVAGMHSVQTEALTSASLEQWLCMLTTGTDSLFVSKLRTILLSLVSLRVFGKDFNRKIIKTIGAPESSTWMDFFRHLAETLISVVKGMEAQADGIPIMDYLFAPEPVSACMRACEELFTYEDHLTSGLPVPGHMDQREFIMRVEENLAFFSNSEKLITNANLRTRVGRMVIRLMVAKSNLQNAVKGKSRRSVRHSIAWGPWDW